MNSKAVQKNKGDKKVMEKKNFITLVLGVVSGFKNSYARLQ